MSGMPNFTPNMNTMGYQQPQATSINVIILPDISMADQYPVGPGSRLMFINEKMTEFRMKGRDTAGVFVSLHIADRDLISYRHTKRARDVVRVLSYDRYRAVIHSFLSYEKSRHISSCSFPLHP